MIAIGWAVVREKSPISLIDPGRECSYLPTSSIKVRRTRDGLAVIRWCAATGARVSAQEAREWITFGDLDRNAKEDKVKDIHGPPIQV